MNELNLTECPPTPVFRSLHASLSYPIQMKLFTSHLVHTPRSMGCDGVIGYGGGTGVGFDMARKAYGEFLERNHFFCSVPVSARKRLEELEDKELCSKLLNMCRQVQIHDQGLENHSFNMAPVIRLHDKKKCDYLYNAVSLNPIRDDAGYLRYNDSCSCATHHNLEKALANSLKEYIERQALVGSWMSKRYRYAVDAEVLMAITPFTHLIEQLIDNGSLYIYENAINLPGYSIIIFYFSKSSDDLVQYSVGASAGFSLEDALHGALNELWQCYCFQYNSESSTTLNEKAGSDYHLNFQQCNHQDTRKLIPFIEPTCQPVEGVIQSYDDLKRLKRFSLSDVVAQFNRFTKQLYYYHGIDETLGMHYVKMLSPDFFMHMAVDKKINLEQEYARSLGLDYKNAYRERIPFP
jgi:hypothetical protein